MSARTLLAFALGVVIGHETTRARRRQAATVRKAGMFAPKPLIDQATFDRFSVVLADIAAGSATSQKGGPTCA